MDYKARILPTRETLSRVKNLENNTLISDVDLLLNLIATADIIRDNIYSRLSQNYDISEGKFILLMALYSEGEVAVSELALRIGVAPATVSIMVKRMLNDSNPLISINPSEMDKRSRVISLTQNGIKLIQTVLPNHLKAVRSFADVLNDDERELMISMLKKLQRM
ncbi:hypothetical protein RCS94_11090 [Orbaceae bacterium ac157xtp]